LVSHFSRGQARCAAPQSFRGQAAQHRPERKLLRARACEYFSVPLENRCHRERFVVTPSRAHWHTPPGSCWSVALFAW